MAQQGKIAHRRLQSTAAALAVGAVLAVSAAYAPQAAAAQCARVDDLAGINLPSGCLTPAEGSAIRLRIFRAEMAVAALSCDQQPLYNTFVTRHQDELVKEGQVLRATFARLHRGTGEKELNRFITHLANRAAMQSLGVSDYCRSMARLFQQVIAQPRQGLMTFIEGGAMVANMETAAGSVETVAQVKPVRVPATRTAAADE